MNTFILELDGKPAGRLSSVESTGFKTEVLSKPTNPFSPVRPQITPSDIKIKFGADASRSLLNWGAGPAGTYFQKSGAIIVLDARSVVLSRIDFADAMITSFVMPAVDRSSRAAASFSASFRPQKIAHSTGGNKLTTGSTLLPVQKTWNASNFKFNVDGLPIESHAVTKVSAISLKTPIRELYSGQDRFPQQMPTKTFYSNVVITVPMSKAASLLSWAEDTVSGRSVPSAKNGSLEYLGPGDKMTYFTAEFTGLGVVSAMLSRSSGDSTQDVIAELYYDSVKLSYI